MKRTVALWAAVSMLVVASWTADVRAQYQQPPASPPPDRPNSAAADTLGRTPPPSMPGTTPPPAQMTTPADTMTTAARIRRAQKSQMTYVFSLALGTAINSAPEAFTEEYDPAFGLYIDGGVRRWELELTLSFDMNFFFTNRQNPDDLSIMNLFMNLKYRPLKTTARPYVLACAGYWRSWIVDELDPANPPETFEYETQSGDNAYTENVLGYGVGGGIEIEMDKTRRIFFEGRYVQGQTRETQGRENMVIIPIRLGLTWEI
jgi:hypothetical protein